jgi:hypothetical protein
MNEIFANTSNLNNPLLNVTLSFNNLDNTKPIVNVPASTSNFQSIYLKKASSAYKIISSPMQTHDLIGRMLIAENFKVHVIDIFKNN